LKVDVALLVPYGTKHVNDKKRPHQCSDQGRPIAD
jgi:hypothetical protein